MLLGWQFIGGKCWLGAGGVLVGRWSGAELVLVGAEWVLVGCWLGAGSAVFVGCWLGAGWVPV
eukprot:4583822-Lingulodinium_polyedra.AAC.1